MEQRTPEWQAARLGKITGTKAHNLLQSPATRKTLLVQLFREVATASAKIIPETPAMLRGTELEPEAVRAYEEYTNQTVHGENDYITHPTESRFAFSPETARVLVHHGFYIFPEKTSTMSIPQTNS